MQNFSETVTTAAGWNNLIILMQANGYNGGAVQSFVTVSEDGGNDVWVKTGHNSAAVAPAGGAEGFKLNSKDHTFWDIDAGMCWIYTAGAYDVGITSSSPVNYGV